MKNYNLFIIFLVLFFLGFSPNVFAQSWQEYLEENTDFDVIDTLDELDDYQGSVRNGYSYDPNDMPKKLDGRPSIWGLYSYYSNDDPKDYWIKDHGLDYVMYGRGKSLRIDYESEYGPSRMGIYLGDDTPSSGYGDLYVFYMLKIPTPFFPREENGEYTYIKMTKHLQVSSGFRDAENWGSQLQQDNAVNEQSKYIYGENSIIVKWGRTSNDLYKMIPINNPAFADSVLYYTDSTDFKAGKILIDLDTNATAVINSTAPGANDREWSGYNGISIYKINGEFNIGDTVSDIADGGYGTAVISGITHGRSYHAYGVGNPPYYYNQLNITEHEDKWIGIEYYFHLGSVDTEDSYIEIWQYDSEGNVLYSEKSSGYVGKRLFPDHKYNKVVLGGNRDYDLDWPGNIFYVDDIIINGSLIGPTYFTKRNEFNNATPDTTPPSPPTGLKVE